MAGPLASPEPWNLVAKDYDELVLPLFTHFAERAVELLELKAPGRVLDVACGPGTATLLLAKAAHEVDAIDFSKEMVAHLKDRINNESGPGAAKVRPQLMDGQRLEFASGSFEGALSMFGLMFFPDRARGFQELYRVLKPGARACVSSWLPLADVPLMKWAFGAFAAATPAPPAGAPPREPMLEDAETFKAEMSAAGFSNIQILRHSVPLPITDIDEFWANMVRSTAPIVLFRHRVGEAQWAEVNAKTLELLRSTAPADLGNLTMNAWLGVGQKL
jgi:SAM-dependent methyltransferase